MPVLAKKKKFCFYPDTFDTTSKPSVDCQCNGDNMCGSEGELLDCSTTACGYPSQLNICPPEESREFPGIAVLGSPARWGCSLVWCEVCSRSQSATLCTPHYNGAAKEPRRLVKYVMPPTHFELLLYFTRKTQWQRTLTPGSACLDIHTFKQLTHV